MINDIEQIKEYDFFLYFSFQFFHGTYKRSIRLYVYLIIKSDESLILSFGTT